MTLINRRYVNSLIWLFGALLNPDCLEAYHALPSEGKNIITVKFSKKKQV